MSPVASTRWCPTPEQVMILEEMYRGGVRTPNAAQIQQITAHLSLYGKIEGKNVFYWFQNHKARDRQKLRKKLLGKQLQQHQQQILFSSPPLHYIHHHNNHTFSPPLDQHFSHNNTNNSFLHHHLPPLPPPSLPPCCGPTPPSLGLFHQLPTLNTSYLPTQARAEDIVPRMTTNTYTWKMDTSSHAKCGRENTNKSAIMSMFTNNDDNHDDWMMMRSTHNYHNYDDNNDNDDEHDDSTRRSIKTLELFPIKDKASPQR